jgi:hypothetical protein
MIPGASPTIIPGASPTMMPVFWVQPEPGPSPTMIPGASLTRIPAFAKVAPKTVISANVIAVNVFFIFLFSKKFFF